MYFKNQNSTEDLHLIQYIAIPESFREISQVENKLLTADCKIKLL